MGFVNSPVLLDTARRFVARSLCIALCVTSIPSLALAMPNESPSPPDAAATSSDVADQEPARTKTEQARLVYQQAVQAYGEQRYKDAILLFQQADGLKPNPAFAFNIGTAYEDMGDSAMALSYYRTYLRQLPQASDRDEVDQRVRRLERALADKGLQQVTILSNPSSAVVVLDGKSRGVTPWTGEIAPGAHTVRLSLTGYGDEVRHFDLPPGRAIDVPVTLRRPGSTAGVVNLNQLAEPPEEPAPWEHIRPLTWGVFGAGVLALGGALGFELARSDLQEQAQAATDRDDRTRFHDRAQRQEVWAKGLLMLGLGLGVTAMALGYQNIDDGLSRQKARVCLDWVPGEHGRIGFVGTF